VIIGGFMKADGGMHTLAIPSLSFHGHLSTSQMDGQLSKASAFLDSAETMSVDLSASQTFDVVALLQLLSVAASRRERSLETQFRLPIDVHARHILRLWQFPTAVSTVLSTPFRLLVSSEDAEYFGEAWPDLFDPDAFASPRANALAYLVGRMWFGLHAYRLDELSGRRRLLDDEVEHWSRYPLSAMLEHMLKGPASDIVRVLVQEFTANVLNGPAPHIAVVGSQLELSSSVDRQVGGGEGEGTLTLAVWNNAGWAVRNSDERSSFSERGGRPGPSRQGDEFVVEASGWTPSRRVYDAGWQPDARAAEPEILIAKLIASTPLSEAGPAYPKDTPGLYALYKTTVDTFGGTLEIRSGRTWLRISGDPDSDGTRYLVRAITGPQLLFQQGSILGARLPVHDV
jgi:hypothetical protein